MSTIKATVTDRRIELEVPADWPDGTQVEIHPLTKEADEAMPSGEVDALLAAMDEFEPLEFTDAELAAWETHRQARRDWEKMQFAARAGKLQGIWE